MGEGRCFNYASGVEVGVYGITNLRNFTATNVCNTYTIPSLYVARVKFVSFSLCSRIIVTVCVY